VFQPVSIERFRKFIEKYGVFIFGLMFVAFIVSFASQGGQCGRLPKQQSPGQVGTPVATLGKYSATDSEIRNIVNQDAAQSQSQFGPLDQANAFASGTNYVIAHLLYLGLAADKGINMDDNGVQEAIPSMWNAQVDRFKQILVSQGKLKPNATAQELADAFQKDADLSRGQTLDQARDSQKEAFNTAFADPTRTELMRAEVARQVLTLREMASLMVTDEEVKNSFNSYTVQMITFVGKTGTEGQQAADKALAEIKGGLSFDAAINKYSTQAPPGATKKTDTFELRSFTLQSDSAYKPLLTLKVGDVSPAIDNGQSTVIYKITKITPDPTNGYASQKDSMRSQMLMSMAGAQMQREIEDLKKSGKLVWKSPAYKAMYDFSLGMMATDQAQVAKDVQEEAQAALTSDTANQDVAALAYFLAESTIYNAAGTTEKKALAKDRITAIETVLKTTESPELRIELADLYVDANRTPEAIAQYASAAKNNQGTSAGNFTNYSTILARLNKMKEKNQITEEQSKPILADLQAWRDVMAQEEQFKAEAKKRDAAVAEENRKLMAKQAAEQAAKDAAAKKAAAKSTTTGGAKPTTSRTGVTASPAPANQSGGLSGMTSGGTATTPPATTTGK